MRSRLRSQKCEPRSRALSEMCGSAKTSVTMVACQCHTGRPPQNLDWISSRSHRGLARTPRTVHPRGSVPVSLGLALQELRPGSEAELLRNVRFETRSEPPRSDAGKSALVP